MKMLAPTLIRSEIFHNEKKNLKKVVPVQYLMLYLKRFYLFFFKIKTCDGDKYVYLLL